MDTLVLLQQLGIAVLLGGLIGLERERKDKSGDDHFAGFRTFGLIGVLGFLGATLYEMWPVMTIVITVGFLGLVIAAYVASSKGDGDIGITTEIAAILVYIIGGIVAVGMYTQAVSIAVLLLIILRFKGALHKWARAITEGELNAAIQFLIIAFMVLPILPNEAFGPYGFFNPYLVWLMVVFISGISFASYIAIKLLGQKKGICVTGFLAGFISSTALAFSFSEESKKNKRVVNPYVLAILIASTAMFFRVLIEIWVVNPDLLEIAMLPIISMGVAGLVLSTWLYFRKEKTPKKLADEVRTVPSPFRLGPALKFGLLFAAVLFVTEAAGDWFGSQGVYVTSVISGLMDVDAITISLSQLADKGVITGNTAAMGITLAAITNTMAKASIFLLFGGRKVAFRVMAIFVVISLIGAGALFI